MNPWFGGKVARLPDRGVLLFATDLQGNLRDFHAMLAVYEREKAASTEPILAFCGDLVHGPSPDMHDIWPEYLGHEYRDESAQLVREFSQISQRERVFSLMGNHEHAHVGGPVVPKFYPDEAAVLDQALGDDAPAWHALLRTFPLLAVAPCGLVLTHGAPGATEPTLADFEALDYAGYESVSINDMFRHDTLGALLWSRSANEEQAQALLHVALGRPEGVVAFGHDVVREGYEKVGNHQICVSTSYGLFNHDKVYLRLDLGARYRTVNDLQAGAEIRHLYPAA